MEKFLIAFFILILILLIGLILYLIIRSVYDRYKKKHPEKYYGGKVFLAELLSITPNINVCTDLSKEINIYNAEKESFGKILIQKTSNSEYYREIITGKLIPVFTKTSYIDLYKQKDEVVIYSGKSCVFVKRYDRITYSDTLRFINTNFFLKDVSSNDVKKYIDERKAEYKGFATFKDYLDDVFAQGEKYYADSLAKGEISDGKKIEDILKNLK